MKVARPFLAWAVVVVAVFAVVAEGSSPVRAAATTSRFCDTPAPTEPAPERRLESYRAINPQRLVDTRDGTGGTAGPLDRRCTLRLDLSSSSVPAGATAVALSLTAVADVGGFFTVYPCASGRPDTSNLNSRPGVATPNLVVALLDSARDVCVYSNQQSHVVIDLAGWWGPGPDRFGSIEPERVYDTRQLPGAARLPAQHIRNVPIGGGPIPADATAAVVNLTVTDATDRGWLLAYPCGNPAPLASNLNFLAGEARAVAAIVGLGSSGAAKGQMCVRSNRDVHVIVDVVGYYAPAPAFGPTAALQPAAGTRVADSRDGTGGWSQPFAAGEVREIDPLVGHPDAAAASAVLLNVVATNGASRGHLRIYPCGSLPDASSLNFPAATSAANLVPVELSRDRTICVYAHQRTDVVIDRFGVMTAPEGSLVERLAFGSLRGFPDYHHDGSDYGILCGSGPTTTFDLHVEPLPGTTVRFDGTALSPGVHRRTMATDDVAQLTLRRGGRTDVHYLRCLPGDFPDLEVDRPRAPTPGWYLTTFGQGSNPQSGPYVVILDDRGAPVWYKRADRVLLDAKQGPGGSISVSTVGQFFGTTGDDLSRRVYDLAGRLIDEVRSPDAAQVPVDHHDFVHLPGGGGAYVSYPLRTGVDLRALGPGFNADDSVVDGAIVEVDAAGQFVWGWTTENHFSDTASTYPQRFGRYPDPNGGEVDVVHINSIDRTPDGDYVVSARHLDTVFRVDRQTGNVEWTLGPVTATSPGAVSLAIQNDPLGGPQRAHDARFSNGLLTMFDNRTGAPGSARYVAYAIDPAAGTATLVEQRPDSLGRTSNALGSARRAADGSVLVDWGLPAGGSPFGPMFEELDAQGRRMLSIAQRPYGSSYRIVKYPASDFNRAALRSTAGGALEVP